jgi:hypothetical protein
MLIVPAAKGQISVLDFLVSRSRATSRTERVWLMKKTTTFAMVLGLSVAMAAAANAWQSYLDFDDSML